MREMCRLHCVFVLLGGRAMAGVGQRRHKHVVNVEAQLVTYQEDSSVE